MLLITDITDSRTRQRVSITHSVEKPQGSSPKAVHVLRVYLPGPIAGQFAGELIAEYRLSEADAMELKKHL